MAGSTAPQLSPTPRESSPAPERLLNLIGDFCQAGTLAERTAAFVRIVRWTRSGRGDRDMSSLLRLVHLLEDDSGLREQVQLSLAKTLRELDSLALFAEAGLPSVHSFPTEVAQRLVAKLMPSAREDCDARKLLIEL